MATAANDLLTRAIEETKHLYTNEIFLVRDLFKGYEATDCYWGLCS